MSFGTAIIAIVLVWMFKSYINQLLGSWIKTASKYSEAAEYHAQRVSEFTRVDAEYASKEAKIRAESRLKALKESHKDLPEL